MFMIFLETSRNFFYRRSCMPVEQSLKAQNILEYISRVERKTSVSQMVVFPQT